MSIDTFESQFDRLLVAVAPPTPNGDLHLGHLSGPYLATDVYSRYWKSQGKQVYFVTGSDDHQSYVHTKGMKMGKSPKEVVEIFGTSIPKTLDSANIKLDFFLKPYHTPEYQSFVQKFFTGLVENGALEKRKGPAFFCEACNLYLYEAHVSGGCPGCHEKTNGNGCEKCGFVNDCIDLQDPKCNHCHSTPATREYERFYFPLNKYSDYLRGYFSKVSMNGHLHALTKKMIREGYPDVSATHLAGWGIPVPDQSGHVIYEWVEMAAGYLYLAETLTGSWEKFFKDPRSLWVLGYGFDNAFFYTSFIPALLHAYDAEIQPPRAFLSNEFYLLKGLKFSTSRNHAVWGDEFLAKIPADQMRYYLSYTRPEIEQTNFDPSEFETTIQKEFILGWEGWVRDLPKKGNSDPLDERRRFEQRMEELRVLTEACYRAESFSLRSAVRLLNQLVFEASQYGKKWEFTGGAVAAQAFALRQLARASAPLLPDFSTRAGVLAKEMGA